MPKIKLWSLDRLFNMYQAYSLLYSHWHPLMAKKMKYQRPPYLGGKKGYCSIIQLSIRQFIKLCLESYINMKWPNLSYFKYMFFIYAYVDMWLHDWWERRVSARRGFWKNPKPLNHPWPHCTFLLFWRQKLLANWKCLGRSGQVVWCC